MKHLIPLLAFSFLVGCDGEKSNVAPSEGPIEEAATEAPSQDSPEETASETKPLKAISVNPNLKYEIKDYAVTITGCDEKASGELIIPAKIEGKPVTSIGISAFRSCSNLTSITIGNGVTRISDFAFLGCTSLTSITIGNGVTSISNSAFNRCISLRAVTFLGDAPKAGQRVFSLSPSIIYRNPEAKGWGDTFGGATVKLIGETSSERPIASTPAAKTDEKFPSSTKEVMFGSNPVVKDKDKAFWAAAKSGNLEAMRRLLGEGVDVNIYGSTIGVDFGCTALFWAAKHNHIKVVQFLLERDAYIDAGAGIGGAPLHIAAYEGHSEIVKLLISEGANAEAKAGDGKTVFDFANEEIAALIRKSIEEKQK